MQRAAIDRVEGMSSGHTIIRGVKVHPMLVGSQETEPFVPAVPQHMPANGIRRSG